MTLAVCPWGLAWPWLLAHWMVIFQNKGLKGVIYADQHALALVECPWGLHWLLLLAYGGCLGLGYVL